MRIGRLVIGFIPLNKQAALAMFEGLPREAFSIQCFALLWLAYPSSNTDDWGDSTGYLTGWLRYKTYERSL